ncbi:MAG: lipid-A-disaccharide synthase [Oligoflexia bacterium]|nr:lipid-A-disaccharide synthase [Oligoflexia bacterium]
MKNCLIIAGERSGEEHALSFLNEFIQKTPSLRLFGVGGDDMKALGVELLYHLKDFSGWGISEVLTKIPFYLLAMKKILSEVKSRDCKMAILIDFQEFNFQLAKMLKKRGVAVFYYVAPQAWVWRSYRASVLGNIVHTLFTILPFEKEWFSQRGVKNIKGVTHPILKHYSQELSDDNDTQDTKDTFNILLLPGSRRHEVCNLLPQFISAIASLKSDSDSDSSGTHIKKITTSLVIASSVNRKFYSYYENQIDKIYPQDELTTAIKHADLALASSGTVTLTTALFKLPTVVCYKTSLFSELIYRYIVKYYGPVSLTNIIFNEMIFPEVLQNRLCCLNIKMQLKKFLTDSNYYLQIKNKLKLIRDLLAGDDFSTSQYLSEQIEKIYSYEN